MFSFFNWSKSSPETPTTPAITMEQPASQSTPSNGVITEQPTTQEPMQMKLRGGGEAGDVCCGVCAGLACFECCEECC
ncbi:hypothetical protein ASPWEDRAFT_171052 [Aspergillus wentii DTO 134E9]|uniref:Cysteine-rich transmembrane CYSTM domain-containing protein n=1 Tax=Aspergillus wentii DTO 134E9 TaxID=1073089 RepID=A0A1L9RRQ7_ASPWE|nr:uncharacterized protein ASPWEDRAFT_171052 [Aspergillus wentii DTO 134E9]KAI9930424.1 hypothetical protein MW887_011178 [Aspergillus wentii]OJJ37584.1 hypothetical protein ASPWEDRAFT_171052 [Aspergillus wentii DTO 134E9]